MTNVLRRAWDGFRGSGDAAVTVPPMDGPLRPNQLIEESKLLAEIAEPDNLVISGSKISLSSGADIFNLNPANGKYTKIFSMESAVTAIASNDSGILAVGMEKGGIVIKSGPHDGLEIDSVSGRALNCPVALQFEDSGCLLVANGSKDAKPSQWRHDLLERKSSGSVWRVELATGQAELLADKLAWPFGIAVIGDGSVAISESWKHRILKLQQGGKRPIPVLDDLPGYPARMSPAKGGGWWLSVFAPRSQLVEFVQREKKFRTMMMQEIKPDYWIAPTLSPSKTFLEPLQGGGLKHLGILKPWAPSRSYGLVVKLDEDFQPIASFHSRADGRRHGVASSLEFDGKLLIASKGGDVISFLSVDGEHEPS
jgi:hypothetical protein